MSISDEAVEAAARAVYANADTIQTPEYATEIARWALEAAAPYMHDKAAETRLLAIAWEEGALSAITNTSTRLTNPYRSQA